MPGSAVRTPELEKRPADTAKWPNPAESRVDYYQRLKRPIQFSASGRKLRVAIVGAGIAGLTAARELLRGGVRTIHIFEASDRIGGRLRTEPVASVLTPYELGAMRMPFFPSPGSFNSALEYYVEHFGLVYEKFPNPGTGACNTGIWVNDGWGPDPTRPYARPHLDVWRKAEGGLTPPAPHPIYREIKRKWDAFAGLFQAVAKEAYGSDERWWPFWQSVAATYWNMNFRDLVYAPRKAAYTTPGDFGGLGMSEKEAELFYVIGMGDGGWGAFYDVSALWVIRTMLSGFGSELQLIVGRLSGKKFAAPVTFTPSGGTGQINFGFMGIQSLAECMLTDTVDTPDGRSSLCDRVKDQNSPIKLHVNTPVVEVTRPPKSSSRERPKITVTVQLPDKDKTRKPDQYDAVIVTTPTWAGQMSISFASFGEALRRFAAPAMKRSHTIMSAKVFYPLKDRFWEGRNAIPQVICTDTFIQSMYAYAYDAIRGRKRKKDPGVLLASYTWEDDALKLVGIPDKDLGQQCLNHLDDIVRHGAIDDSGEIHHFAKVISDYVEGEPRVLHWVTEPTYIGCSKLYRQRSWHYDYDLLNFNKHFGKETGLYLAGEAYSVEGGWTEPALRSAIDAVARLAGDHGGSAGPLTDIPAWCPGCVSLGPENADREESRQRSPIIGADVEQGTAPVKQGSKRKRKGQ